MTDEVTTAQGRVSGFRANGPFEGVRLYNGIPYAAPPVGELRWAPPVDPAGWDGVRDCRALAPGALQQFHNDWFTHEGYVPGYRGQTPPMSEDCLYLNVATPATGEDPKLPVYVWFHGGGLTNGFAREAPTDPVLLASKGLVVVSVAQRINAFGYLALPQLRAERGTSGNYGFMDQLKAMEWIYANIAAFGGDPANITVGGQSGGAQKAGVLVAEPHSVGHIRGVVSVSGLKWMQPLVTQTWAEEHGRQLLTALGVSADAPLEELRALDAEIFLSPMKRDLLPDYMVTDDLLPFENLREGIDRYGLDVDFLNGMAQGETDVFARSASNPDFVPPVPAAPFTTVEQFEGHFRSLLGELAESTDLASAMGVTDENAWESARVLASRGLAGSERTNISRNLMLNRVFGRYLEGAGGQGSVFNYLWSRRIPVSPHDLGTSRDPANGLSWHGADTWYLFGTLQPEVSRDRPWTADDAALAETMTSYVANFVATGDPNGPGLPEWPRANDDFGYIDIGDDIVAHDGCTSAVDILTRDIRRARVRPRGSNSRGSGGERRCLRRCRVEGKIRVTFPPISKVEARTPVAVRRSYHRVDRANILVYEPEVLDESAGHILVASMHGGLNPSLESQFLERVAAYGVRTAFCVPDKSSFIDQFRAMDACMALLRGMAGTIVLMGQSRGAALMSGYQAIAENGAAVFQGPERRLPIPDMELAARGRAHAARRELRDDDHARHVTQPSARHRRHRDTNRSRSRRVQSRERLRAGRSGALLHRVQGSLSRRPAGALQHPARCRAGALGCDPARRRRLLGQRAVHRARRNRNQQLAEALRRRPAAPQPNEGCLAAHPPRRLHHHRSRALRARRREQSETSPGRWAPPSCRPSRTTCGRKSPSTRTTTTARTTWPVSHSRAA